MKQMFNETHIERLRTRTRKELVRSTALPRCHLDCHHLVDEEASIEGPVVHVEEDEGPSVM